MILVVASNDFGRFLSSVTGRMLKHEAELAQPTGYQDFQFQGNEFLWKTIGINCSRQFFLVRESTFKKQDDRMIDVCLFLLSM